MTDQADNNTVWLVLRMTSPHIEIRGLYSSEENAVKRCSVYYDVIGPLEIDGDFPEDPTEWTGAYYPLFAGIGDEGQEQNADGEPQGEPTGCNAPRVGSIAGTPANENAEGWPGGYAARPAGETK